MATSPLSSEASWLSQQLAAMAAAWGRGEPEPVEAILARTPGIDHESAIRIIYEDVCLRREAGREVDEAEVLRRFPQWADELEVLFDCDRLLSQPGDVPAYPEIGQTLGPFRLLAELGRGASGRTYLAAESALADRPVVVKVIPADQDEHLALARLQHTHIVPLYSEHAVPEKGLRVLCMPYLGGTSLEHILDALAREPIEHRTGWSIVLELDRAARRGEPRVGVSRYRNFFEESSYVEAVTRIVFCLADALTDAHARGLIHMDVKPSNVLIAADGQPMLLDFHLARGPVAAGARAVDRLGGTKGWMSPEQAEAMEAISLGRPVPRAVDARSDIYSLGLLLREALAGSPPGAGLREVIAASLAPRPEDRYPTAAALADDLHRCQNGLPPRGVGRRSFLGGWNRWRRWLGTLAVAAAVAMVAAAVYYQNLGRQVQRARAQEAREEQARLVEGLHDLADSVRVQPIEAPDADRILDGVPALWAERDASLVAADAPEARRRIQDDLLELVTAWLDRAVRRGEARSGDDLARLRRTIDEAETLPGRAYSLRVLRRRLDGHADAARPSPRTPEDAYDHGRVLLREGDVKGAYEQFRRAREERPQELWPQFFEGLCAYQLRHYEEAVAAFRTCIALQPRQAAFYYHRALAFEALGRYDEAVRDDARALDLDPKLARAAFNRGVVHYKQSAYNDAVADLEAALGIDDEPRFRALVHYNLALARLALGHRAAARLDAERARPLDTPEVHALLKQLDAPSAR